MLKALRGTKDILPNEATFWQQIEASARDIFSIYGYKEIRTPIIEEASLFVRSIGEVSDIVQKEMYDFTDRGGRNIALRPEATASIVRSYLENSIGQKEGFTKLFYIGPMFRSERPQKGRQRQFHQIGVEAIGSDSPLIDVEVILLAVRFLESIGIEDFTLKINSLGCSKDKLKIMEGYRKSIKPHLGTLCNDCNQRYSKNVLRIFDCKDEACRDIVNSIKTENSLCKDCSDHFESVKKTLKKSGINYKIDSKIVRGLDYYTKTVFEITQKDLGAKDAICAGGRYNSLIKDMGGKDTPAIGFAFGIERLALAIKKDASSLGPSLDVFIAVPDKELSPEAFTLVNSLRDKGISCDIDYENKTLKSQMKRSERLSSKFTVIFGGDEFSKGKVVLRNMKNRTQKEIELGKVYKEIQKAI